jgi:hypothetical protein
LVPAFFTTMASTPAIGSARAPGWHRFSRDRAPYRFTAARESAQDCASGTIFRTAEPSFPLRVRVEGHLPEVEIRVQTFLSAVRA